MPIDPPPNVVIAVLDDVGVDQVSPYGFPGAPPTPTIQALADDGLRFDHAWATPLCSPTRAALLTGQHPRRNHIGAVIHARTGVELPLEAITLPEMLDRSGTDWSSAAVGKWHLGTTNGPSGVRHAVRQGFDLFAGSMNNPAKDRTLEPKDTRSYVAWERVGFDGKVGLETTFSTTQIADDAIEALGRLKEPFLLYVAFHAAHAPLMAPPAELVRGIEREGDKNSLYAQNVVAADRELGRVLRALGDKRERTLVIVLGDNGTPRVGKDEDGQEGNKGSFTEGGVRVPFIVSGPPVKARGSTNALAHVVDVFPTLMDLAGVPAGRIDAPLDGVSLVPVFTDKRAQVHDRLYTELRHPESGPPWTLVEQAARDRSLKVVNADGRENWVFRIDGYREERVEAAALSAEERERAQRLERYLAEMKLDPGAPPPARPDNPLEWAREQKPPPKR